MIERTAALLNSWLETHWRLYVSVAAILCLLTFSGYSRPKTPWVDEVLQLTIERLPTAGAIWDALKDGVQIDPPMLHVGVHYLFRAFGESIYLARLPSILGFCLMCVAVACLVARYAPPIYAAAAFFLPYATVLRSRGMDARPYGLMFGLSALVLWCWDGIERSPRKTWWRIAFTVSLALTFSTHFYSILILLPLAMGEAAKTYFRKRLDWASLACIAAAMIPYFLWLPILISGAKVYASHYYYPAAFANLYDFYGSTIFSLPLAGALLFMVVAIATVGFDVVSRAVLSQGERILLFVSAGFLLVPVAGYLAGVLVTRSFVPYYHYIATFGVILGVPLLLSALSGGSRMIGLCLFLAVVGHGLFVSARGLSGFIRGFHSEYPQAAEFRKLTGEERPDIVIPSPLHFLPMREANKSDPIESFVYLFDSKKALQSLGTDSADLLYERVKRVSPARIEAFDAYVASHPRFYLAVLGPIKGIQEWQYDYMLKQMHAGLWWVGKVGDFDVFRVQADSVTTPSR